jgi:hypothetical protein
MFEQAFRNIDDVLWKEAGCTTELAYTEQTSWLLFLLPAAADSVIVRFPEYEYDLKLAPDQSILFMVGVPKSATSGAPSRLVRRDCH